MPLNALVFHFRTSVERMATGNKHLFGQVGVRRKKRDAQLITDARHSPLENWHHRRRVYVWLQLSRIPVLVLAGIVMWLTHNLAVSVIIAFISVPLPWIAVLIAIQPGEGATESHKVYKPGLAREQRKAAARAELGGSTRAELGSGAATNGDTGNTVEKCPDSLDHPDSPGYIDYDEITPPPSQGDD